MEIANRILCKNLTLPLITEVALKASSQRNQALNLLNCLKMNPLKLGCKGVFYTLFLQHVRFYPSLNFYIKVKIIYCNNLPKRKEPLSLIGRNFTKKCVWLLIRCSQRNIKRAF